MVVYLLYLDFYVLGDDALVGWVSLMRAGYLCVLVRILVEGGDGAVGPVLALQKNIYTDRSKAVLLLWIFHVFPVLCLLCLCVCPLICALWSPAGKG